MPTRMNRPDRVNARRKTALSNLEKRVALDDAALVADAKRFKNVNNPVEKDINKYRSYLNKQIQILKGRVQ